MGVDNDDEDDDEDSQDEEVKLDVYNPKVHRSQFVAFSKLKPKKIMDRIIFKLLDDDIEPELNREQMKVTFHAQKQLPEDEQEENQRSKHCFVQSRLYKLQDQEQITAIVF